MKDFIYVSLLENRESFTAYEGAPIWKMIYEENCKFNPMDSIDSCSEETLLFQLMSGLHTSINTHISDGFFEEDEKVTNMTYFYSRVGDHEDRIKNLYLVYAAAVKAVSLIEPTLLQ